MILFIPWLLALAVLVQAARLALIWAKGARAEVDWRAGLRALPKRYLVDVHHVVARKKTVARMHVAVAGGLAASTLLLMLGALPGLHESRIYWLAVVVAAGTGMFGTGLVIQRRRPKKPAHLSGGAFRWLPVGLSYYGAGIYIAALGALLDISPMGALGALSALAGGVILVGQLFNGPMRHALAGSLYLAAHPRPERFGGRSTDLKPGGLDGVQKFAWNQLLAFDACIQCGRCEEACPAFAAEQPLNPKALIQDLCAAQHPGQTYAGSPHPGIISNGEIKPETLWSCTTCRACVEACPMMIEHVDAVIDLRRHETLAKGAAPGKAEAVLGNLRYTGNSVGQAAAGRTEFCAGSGVRVIKPGERTDILLWLGDGAFDARYGATLRALVEIMQAANLDFAVLGEAEQECGDIARRLGDEAGFQRQAVANIAALQAVRFSKIVTADPHALHVLRNEYPAFGGSFTVQHHTALIEALLADGHITVQPGTAKLTYHDPCYLGRYNGEFDAPRRVLARLSPNVLEMHRTRENSFCCGGGGGAPVTDIPGKRRIPDMRMAQADDTGAGIVAVACPGCTAMLEGVAGARPEVRDVAELVRGAMK